MGKLVFFSKRNATIPKPTFSEKKQEELLTKRSIDISSARRLYPQIQSVEEAYAIFCQEHNIQYITPSSVHHAFVKRHTEKREKRNEERKIKFLCPECKEFTVTADPLCPSCPEALKGNKTSLLCNKCLLTTFSPKTIRELAETESVSKEKMIEQFDIPSHLNNQNGELRPKPKTEFGLKPKNHFQEKNNG
jgi:hypothetical protein